MGEPYRTLAEIIKLYPKEWVYIDQTHTRRRSERDGGGVVVLHTADHAEFLRRIFDFPGHDPRASLYTTPPTLYDPDPDDE